MSTMMISEPVAIACSECASGYYEPVSDEGMAECALCGHVLSVAKDVEPYAEEGDRIVWHDIAGSGLILCYFTESTDDDEE